MCYTRILPELEQVIIDTVCPIALPPIVATKVLGFLNQTNSELFLGNLKWILTQFLHVFAQA